MKSLEIFMQRLKRRGETFHARNFKQFFFHSCLLLLRTFYFVHYHLRSWRSCGNKNPLKVTKRYLFIVLLWRNKSSICSIYYMWLSTRRAFLLISTFICRLISVIFIVSRSVKAAASKHQRDLFMSASKRIYDLNFEWDINNIKSSSSFCHKNAMGSFEFGVTRSL